MGRSIPANECRLINEISLRRSSCFCVTKIIVVVVHLMVDPLKAIICGYEKSGTTLINEILRRHPDMDSGFECGFLLGDSPRDFSTIKPYHAFFKSTWELSREDMKYIFNTDSWSECYIRARERSPIIINKNTGIFDKTPIYMLHLNDVLKKVPGVPCVVNVRDPRALMLSWAMWSGHQNDTEKWIRDNFDEYCERYLSYAKGYTNALDLHGDRIMLNQFENLCVEPAYFLNKIFEFIGLSFKTEYLKFSSKHFVYGNTVSTEYLFPYRGVLSEDLCAEILAATQSYEQWHYAAN